MKEKKEAIKYCLETFPEAYLDYPFDEEWAVIRHKSNKKVFAFIFERNGYSAINVKCEPLRAEFLRSIFTAVRPAYHMNKRHWNTIYLDGSIPDEDIGQMIEDSFKLTSSRRKKI